MASEDSLPVLKVLIIGPSGAGKSAYCDDQFDPESSTATIGIDFKMKKLAVRGKAFRLNIFDTAGQERFRTLSTSYYRGAQGVIVVYDISNRKSFLGMEKWIEEARSNASPDAVLYLVCHANPLPSSFSSSSYIAVSLILTTIASFKVGSKLDKVAAGGRAVSVEEGRAFAESQGAGFCEISSKTRENIKRPFVEVVDQIVQRPQLLSAATPASNSTALNLGSIGSGYASACPC
ncbi:Uu.00g086650.m01.CDS01 [Anthostomella pinea]|uniref:Uu.00g086650.m01.CDS01 n=1 Tax=Anthostomella pinea TaxID=933095 RepID=A0AAI8VM66_9PEZI|nr:Uu.00g086650.m01.CDS01 [Anthostomella pinea]